MSLTGGTTIIARGTCSRCGKPIKQVRRTFTANPNETAKVSWIHDDSPTTPHTAKSG